MNIIQTEELAVGYGDKKVVENINIEALKGQFICLLGPNGSGKSTILRSICGFLAPVSGKIFLKEQDVTQLKTNTLAETMAVVLTDRLSPGLMTGFEIAAMGRYPHTGFFGKLSEIDIEKTWEALHLVNAQDIAHRFFNELSDGQKQKLLLARALVQEPEVIVLDEPTTHLDVRHRMEVMNILNTLTKEKGITVILSLHEIDLALKSCDIAILIKDNKILDYGPPEDVIQEDTITNLFDIRSAHYSEFLGTVELTNDFPPSTFVVAGGGTGTRIFRALTKKGYGVATGILHENDVDYYIAKTIGTPLVSEMPFNEIREHTMKVAQKQIEQSERVIDSAFPIGSLNKQNIDLISHAVSIGKPVYSLRSKEECEEIYGKQAANIQTFENMNEMMQSFSSLETLTSPTVKATVGV